MQRTEHVRSVLYVAFSLHTSVLCLVVADVNREPGAGQDNDRQQETQTIVLRERLAAMNYENGIIDSTWPERGVGVCA